MKSDDDKTDVKSKERFHNLVSSGILEIPEWKPDWGENEPSYFLGENKRAVDYLATLQRAVMRVATGTAPAWRETSSRRNGNFLMSRDSRWLWHSIRGIHTAPEAWGREAELNPYLRLGVRLARKWEPRLRFYTDSRSELLISEDYPRESLTKITKLIRRVCRAKRFRARVSALECQAKTNFISCLEYFLETLRVHARPLVLRGDFYVEAGAKKGAAEGKLKKAIEKFIRNLRENRIIDDVLGYIIKLEGAYGRGVHFHLMVIVDGDKHFQSYNLMEMLKTYWIHECVGSPQLASGFNCYLRKDEYLYNAIGHVHYSDERMLRGVREAIEYLTKTDGHFLLPEGLGKSLRKGQAPAPRSCGRRRGAPRKLGNDVSLAERVLLGAEDGVSVGRMGYGESGGRAAAVVVGGDDLRVSSRAGTGSEAAPGLLGQ